MMTIATLIAVASPALALSYGAQPKYEARPGTQIYRVGAFIYDGTDPSNLLLIKQGQQFVDAEDLLAGFISENNLESLMPEARKWVGEEFYSDTKPNLSALRLKKGLTQNDLARLTEQPQPSIARLESGSEAPSIDRAKRIATALGVSLDQYYDALNETRKGKA